MIYRLATKNTTAIMNIPTDYLNSIVIAYGSNNDSITPTAYRPDESVER